MHQKTDFIVIGSGIAGIRAAIEIAASGARVVVLTKSRADESNTEYAQGGIAVVLNDEDEVGLHYEDTINAGDGLCDPLAVQTLVEEGPARIQELIDWGTQFDRAGGCLAFTREAAHSRRRILHAQGDSTGREVNRSLFQKVKSLPEAVLRPHCFALQLIVEGGRCRGARYLDQSSNRVVDLTSRAVIMATGGLGCLFRETTNPDVATGDGYALAWQAGAALADMEFVQFHPTALKLESAPRFLLSEALRGEGARLRNAAGELFMEHYHPDAELAPRDIVSRSIVSEARLRGDDHVLLDISHLEADFVRRRFPRITETCDHFGIDITSQAVPVFPAAHYMMGGIYTDLCGRTTVAGLYAAGEAACNGVHGANRLASNSLLDGLVFGCRAGRAVIAGSGPASLPADSQNYRRLKWKTGTRPADRAAIRHWMTEQVGIVRSGESMQNALDQLSKIGIETSSEPPRAEVSNLSTNARLVTVSALLREESRGGHYRLDYLERDDSNWDCHQLIRLEQSRQEMTVTHCRQLQNRPEECVSETSDQSDQHVTNRLR